MRLINGDRLLMKLKQHRLLFFKAYGDFSCFSEKDKARVDEIDNCIAEVINALTIDAVPVVRCKDCKHGIVDDEDFPNQYLCKHNGCDWNEGKHYCSYGEWREENADN